MRTELRRSLFAAAIAGVTLAGCGGGGGGGGTAAAPAPAPSPSPPAPAPAPSPNPTSAGSYYLLGRVGFTSPPAATIPFGAGASVAASSFGLIYADATALPSAFDVTSSYGSSSASGTDQLETGDTTLDFGTVSEYFPSNGTATAWGARYRIYAKAIANSNPPDANLYAVDLRRAGTPPAAPAPVKLAGSTMAALNLCGNVPAAAFDNYRAAQLSWLVFHAQGLDGNCGTADDAFVRISPSAGAASLGEIEPVEAIYDGNGTITGYLAINHPPAPSPAIIPNGPVTLQQLDTNFANTNRLTQTLSGYGVNIASYNGQFLFRSLGISSGNVWLYADYTSFYAVNLSAIPNTVTQITGVSLQSGDTIPGRAIFDAATGKAYVAVDNASGGYVVQIDPTNKAAIKSGVDAAPNLTLVGVGSTNLVYVADNGSAVRSIVKTLASSAVTLNPTLTGTQTIDGVMTSSTASGPATAFMVGDTVFFTVADTSSTGLAKQAFYVNASGSPAATAIPGVSAVLGVMAPATVPASGVFTSPGALVLTGGATFTPGVAAFSYGGPSTNCTNTTAVTTATLSLYPAAGTSSPIGIGLMTSTNPATSNPICKGVTGVALAPGPAQQGMPVTLQFFGTDGAGGNAEDIATFTMDASGNVTTPLTQFTGFSN